MLAQHGVVAVEPQYGAVVLPGSTWVTTPSWASIRRTRSSRRATKPWISLARVTWIRPW